MWIDGAHLLPQARIACPFITGLKGAEERLKYNLTRSKRSENLLVRCSVLTQKGRPSPPFPRSFMRNILVYRDHLLPKSEFAFMHRQYVGFSELRPIWVGRRLLPDFAASGFTPGPVFTGLSGAGFKLFGRVPMRQALRALNPVAIHAQFGRGGALALPLARALGIPLVVTFHGGDAHKSAHWRRLPMPALQRARMQGMIDYASVFLCVSEGVRDRLIARGVPAAKLSVLPIGVEITPLPPRTDPGDTILFIGRMVEMKGLPVLIEAIRRLRAQGLTAPVVLIGDGPDRPAIQAALQGVQGVELRGWQTQDQIAAALAAARLVCIPSVVARSGEAEGLPSVAVEAMRQAVPVVASSDAGVGGLITNGQNGLVFPSRDANALAASIASLLANRATALAMGAAARATVVARYDATQQSRELEQILLHATMG
jgi:colanic acid/amylovoran biosynthesis glycosyltransferase